MADILPQAAVLVADRGYESAKNLERYRDRQRSALASGKQSTGPSSYPPHTMRKNATIIDVRLAMAFGKERLKPRHLRVTQPEQIAHLHPRQFGGVNHEATAASSQSMGPDPRTAFLSSR